MKLIKLFPVILLAFLYNTVFSQSIKWSFFNYSHVATENGNIIVSPISPTPFKINVNFLRPSIEPWLSLPIKGELVLYYEENGQYPLFTTTFTTSDWENGAVLSKTIIRDAVFSHGLLSNSRRSIDVYVKYRYYKDKYPYPENTDGWTEWYTIPSKTVFMLSNSTLPASIISGPSQICDEGIFTITNPYVISLENAAGIATLTDMGLNKWKVTRIGHASGIIKLRSHTSTNVKFEKEITVGGGTQIVIDEMNYLQEVGDGINFGGGYQFKVLPGNGNYKFTGNLKLTNFNTTVPTTYTWSLVSKTATHYTFGWSANDRSVEVHSKGAEGFVVLRCKAVSGCDIVENDYTFYFGLSPFD